MLQMKEQHKSIEKELSKMVKSNLPNEEFNIMVTQMLIRLERRVDELSEKFNKEIESIFKKQSEMKTSVTEIDSRLEDAEEQIIDLEDSVMEITQSK